MSFGWSEMREAGGDAWWTGSGDAHRGERGDHRRRRATRPLSLVELERVIRDAVRAELDMPVSLMSVARTDDGMVVEIECGIALPGPDTRLDRAAIAISSAIEPAHVGAREGATVRVRFAPGALD